MALGFCWHCDAFYDEADGRFYLEKNNRVSFICEECDEANV